METAQEEVLTCLGLCIYDRLYKIHTRLREEQSICQVLAAVAVETLCRNFERENEAGVSKPIFRCLLQMAVDVKRGVSQLELLYEQITKEEIAKQHRKEHKKQKRRRRKEKKVELDEKENSCECDCEDADEEVGNKLFLPCTCSDSKPTTHNNDRHKYSSPMASLVLTDNSQLTAKSFEKLLDQIMYTYAEPYDLQKHGVTEIVSTAVAVKEAGRLRNFLVNDDSVAIMVEPFLIQFQSDAPLAPFLYEALISLMKSLMKRFVKSDKLDSARSLLELGIFNETNLLNAKYVDLGYATREAIRKTKGVSEKEILLFRQDCKTCLQKLCAKLLERSPLKYKLTKAISFLDPAVAVLKSTRSERLKSTLEIVLANNWITGVAADLVDRQFNIKAIGGIEKVDITKSLIHSVRNARSRYKDSLEQKMKDKQNGEKQEGDRKRAALQVLDRKTKGAPLCNCEDCLKKKLEMTSISNLADTAVPNNKLVLKEMKKTQKVSANQMPSITSRKGIHPNSRRSGSSLPSNSTKKKKINTVKSACGSPEPSCQSCKVAQDGVEGCLWSCVEHPGDKVGLWSSSEHSQDCGYSSENTNGSCDIASGMSKQGLIVNPDGVVAGDWGSECHKGQRCGGLKARGLTLQQMLEESSPSDEEESCIPPEEVSAFLARVGNVAEERLELRQLLKKKFDQMCSSKFLRPPRLCASN
uniref:Uncharacterized protein n=1 Tax=Timema shepardi TaxID=629360 RepID=A0A7R9AQ28_TIMSH|nr:unnamed protein product [Timema shepardi]